MKYYLFDNMSENSNKLKILQFLKENEWKKGIRLFEYFCNKK